LFDLSINEIHQFIAIHRSDLVMVDMLQRLYIYKAGGSPPLGNPKAPLSTVGGIESKMSTRKKIQRIPNSRKFHEIP
jgi:hypothetical protein